MAPWLFSQAIRSGEAIRLFNYGKQSRDFTYIDDILQGVVAAIDQNHLPDGLLHRLYNLGNSHSHRAYPLYIDLGILFWAKGHPRPPADAAGGCHHHLG